MEPGRELDILILRAIFAAKRIDYHDYDTEHEWPQYIPSGKPWRTHQIDARPVPRFSVEIAAAWQIVERFRGDGWYVTITDTLDGAWGISINHPTDTLRYGSGASDLSAPHAICLAALKAVGVAA